MKELIEIRWHGRGGQGAVTASKLLATAAIYENYYVQAFPEYGAERMGVPVQSFNRISRKVIDVHCKIDEPNIAIVLDYTLLGMIDVTKGLKKDGIIILNSSKDIDELKKFLQVKTSTNISVYKVDATKISIETIRKAIPNTAMMGALIKVTNFLKLSTLVTTIKETLSEKISTPVVDANILAIKRAYQEVKG